MRTRVPTAVCHCRLLKLGPARLAIGGARQGGGWGLATSTATTTARSPESAGAALGNNTDHTLWLRLTMYTLLLQAVAAAVYKTAIAYLRN
jgi:hypothetical protein